MDDYSGLLDGLSWFGEKANEAIWGIVYWMASQMVSDGFDLVIKYVLVETDPNGIIDFSSYLAMMQSIALALLLFAISWEGVKYQSGLGEEFTLQSLVMKSLFAALSIFFLPFALEHFFIKLNNLIVSAIVATGVKITPGNLGPLSVIIEPNELNMIIIFLFVVLAIATLILAIVAGIRYVEIIILALIAPLAAVSIVRDGELLEIWIKETIAVVFTQSLQVFLLAALINAIGKMGGNIEEIFMVTIGCLVVMISGPQALRKFVYNTGTGSAGTKAVGNAGRMAVYKAISKGAVK